MGFSCDLSPGLTCLLFGCNDLLCDQKFSHSFLMEWPKILFPVFRRATTIGFDVVDMFWVVVLSVVIMMRWS
jgi:hypothetical protein